MYNPPTSIVVVVLGCCRSGKRSRLFIVYMLADNGIEKTATTIRTIAHDSSTFLSLHNIQSTQQFHEAMVAVSANSQQEAMVRNGS